MKLRRQPGVDLISWSNQLQEAYRKLRSLARDVSDADGGRPNGHGEDRFGQAASEPHREPGEAGAGVTRIRPRLPAPMKNRNKSGCCPRELAPRWDDRSAEWKSWDEEKEEQMTWEDLDTTLRHPARTGPGMVAAAETEQRRARSCQFRQLLGSR